MGQAGSTEIQSQGSRAQTDGMGDFERVPVELVGRILSMTTPQDICRSALVCRAFEEASKLDSTWQSMLPPGYQQLLAQAVDQNVRLLRGARNIYHALASQISISDGNKIFWLDRATGGMCYMISSKLFDIVWMDDIHRYWEWRLHPQSRFPESAHLNHVWWFSVGGTFDCQLLPGCYIVSLRIRLEESHQDCWNTSPITFSLDVSYNSLVVSQRHLVNFEEVLREQSQDSSIANLTPIRPAKGGWTDYDIGEFQVNDLNDLITIQFRMEETNSWPKFGMDLDSVIVCPKNLAQNNTQKKNTVWFSWW